MKKWIALAVVFAVGVFVPSLIVGGKMVGHALPIFAWGIGIAFVVGLIGAFAFRRKGADTEETFHRHAGHHHRH